MRLKPLKPKKAINKAFLKVKPNRTEIERFKNNLIQLLDRTNDTESEEFHKNLVTDFLKKTYYDPTHFINTKGRNDLVIHNGDKAASTVGVIIEAKKPTNKAEMLTREKLNVKAFQELVLYYLRERITHKNLEIKYLIATNINEWFIFDANIFEKQFAQHKGFVKQFLNFENARLAGRSTDFFYKEIAEPFIGFLDTEIEFTHFDIRQYESPLRNSNPKDVVTDEDGELFEYNPTNKESQRIQETLFHEKQTIIESCLFGVDINPNSVKICRLRLWIELLKNAYYKNETELETLPNIDINIKWGNSLISRFAIDADTSQALKKSKWNIDGYRLAVDTYRNAQNKEQKREMERLIENIKSDFRTEIATNDPKIKRKARLGGELYNLTMQQGLFEESRKEKKIRLAKAEKIEKELNKLAGEIEEINNNKIYENAFEWRFEFPEVLDERGDFKGFDVVIGNPPYIRIQDLISNNESVVRYYNDSFLTTGKGNYDLYIPFVEKGVGLLKNFGSICYIMPHKFINANYGKQLRGFIGESKFLEKIVHFGASQVFEDATTYTGLFFLSKKENLQIKYSMLPSIKPFIKGVMPIFQDSPSHLLTSEQWMFLEPKQNILLEKIQQSQDTLETTTERIFQGVKTSADKIFIVEFLRDLENDVEIYCKENNQTYQLEKTFLLPLIKGGNSRPYQIYSTDLLLLFPYQNGSLVSEELLQTETPKSWKYLNDHKTFLEARYIKNIPIPSADNDQKGQIELLVSQVLSSKKEDAGADTSVLEAEVDQLVYELYGLTEEEIAIVEEVGSDGIHNKDNEFKKIKY